MIIFLYGADSYRREEKRQGIEREYCKKRGGTSVASFSTGTEKNPSKSGGEELRSYVRNRPLFGGVQYAVFRIEAYGALTKDDITFLKGVLASPDATIIVTAETKPTKPLSFLLEAPVAFQEFTELSGEELRGYVAHQAGLRGMRIPDVQIALLHALHGSDLWGSMTELDMLSLTESGTRTVARTWSVDFMGMLGIVARGDVQQKLPALVRLSREHDAAKTFNVLSASVFGEKKRLMADYDVAMKRGTLDYELALTDFAL